MKRAITISYWVAATVLVAVVVLSIGYRAGESFFIGTLFLPGALAAKYAYAKISASSKDERVWGTVFASLGIIIGEVLLFMLAHYAIFKMRIGVDRFYEWPDLPSMLLNPVFIAVIILVLAADSVLLDQRLSKRFPGGPKTITFSSDRRSVTLEIGSILYIESNDAITIVYAEDGQSYRNKTPISAWESLLGEDFLRIHRSYLVRRSAIKNFSNDTLTVGEVELPVSRKYKSAVKRLS